MRRVNVLHIIDSLKMGGTENRCLDIVEGLDQDRFNSSLVYFNGKGPLSERLHSLGVQHQEIGFQSFRSLMFLKKIAELIAYMRRHDIAVVQTYGYYSNVPGILAAKLARVPAIVASRRDMGDYLTPRQLRLEKMLWRFADCITVNATPIKDNLTRAGVPTGKAIVIHNGIDTSSFFPGPRNGQESSPVVGMVATLRRQKDHITFLDGAALVLQRMPCVRFLLIGTGPYEQEVRDYVAARGLSGQVVFGGMRVGSALREAVQSMSVSVLSSKGNEGLPNVVLEAMAVGKPVVATDVGGTREVVEDGVTGFLVPPRDPRALAEKILWLLDHPEAAEKMGLEGRRRVENFFSLSRMQESFGNLYLDLLHQKGFCRAREKALEENSEWRSVNVLLVGDYPPPYGGISVQVQALQRWIEKESGASCVVLNIGASRREAISGCVGTPNLWTFGQMLWRYARQGHLIHIVTNGHNTKSWLSAFACSVAGILNRRRTIIALDSGAMPNCVEEAGWFLRMLIKLALQLAGKVICRNKRGRHVLLKLGCQDSSVLIIPGYIPAAPSGPESIPSEVQAFLAAHDPVIGTVVAFRPEYGVDILVDAVNQLAIDYPNVGLIIIGSGDEPNAHKVIRDLQQNGRVTVIKDLPHPLCLAVMSRLDIFARCTYYDGDAISVREALTLGLPVVASDTDYRPEGVTLFTKGDVKDLVKKLQGTLEQSVELSVKARRGAMPDTADRILKLYHELAAGTE